MEQCAVCEFFRAGECRANPPEVGDVKWPTVPEDAWCGSWEPVDPPDLVDVVEGRVVDAWVDGVAAEEATPWVCRKGTISPPEVDPSWARRVVYRRGNGGDVYEVWSRDDELWAVRAVGGDALAVLLL